MLATVLTLTLLAPAWQAGVPAPVTAPSAAPPAAAVSATCADADARSGVSPAAQERAVRCLVNVERRRRGLRSLRESAALAAAADSHSRDMVERDYFDHVSPGGETPAQRVRETGYRFSSLGETIAYGEAGYGTPASTVDRWMASPPHRRIILTARLRDIGVGVAPGAPGEGSARGTTVTADFGRR